MSLTYAIPDLHGRFDLLRDVLAGIAAHAAGKLGTIVALGEYVNKGPDSKQVVERLRLGVQARKELGENPGGINRRVGAATVGDVRLVLSLPGKQVGERQRRMIIRR